MPRLGQEEVERFVWLCRILRCINIIGNQLRWTFLQKSASGVLKWDQKTARKRLPQFPELKTVGHSWLSRLAKMARIRVPPPTSDSWVNALLGSRFAYFVTGYGADAALPAVIHAAVTYVLDYCKTFPSHRCLGSFLWLVPNGWCHFRGTNENSTSRDSSAAVVTTGPPPRLDLRSPVTSV